MWKQVEGRDRRALAIDDVAVRWHWRCPAFLRFFYDVDDSHQGKDTVDWNPVSSELSGTLRQLLTREVILQHGSWRCPLQDDSRPSGGRHCSYWWISCGVNGWCLC